MTDLKPQIAADTEEKIRKARHLSEGGNADHKFDAVRLVIEKSINQRVEKV